MGVLKIARPFAVAFAKPLGLSGSIIPGSARAKSYVATGSSTTAAAGSYSDKYFNDGHPDLDYAKIAQGGGTWTTGIGFIPQIVAENPTDVTAWFGINDVGNGQDVPTVLVNAKKFCDDLKAEIPDVKIYLATLPPRDTARAGGPADYEARRKQYADGLYAAIGVWLDGVIPMGDHPKYMTAAAATDPANSADGLHMVGPNQVRQYDEAYAAFMDAVIAGNAGNQPDAPAFLDVANANLDAPYEAFTRVTSISPAATAQAVKTGAGTIKRGLLPAGNGPVRLGDVVMSELRSATIANTATEQTLALGSASDTLTITTANAAAAAVFTHASKTATENSGGQSEPNILSIAFPSGRPIMFIQKTGSNPLTSVLIDGVAAQLVARTSASIAMFIGSQVLSAGTRTVTIDGDGSALNANATVYPGAITGVSATVTGTSTESFAYRNPREFVGTAAIPVPANGIMVAMIFVSATLTQTTNISVVHDYGDGFRWATSNQSGQPKFTTGAGGNVGMIAGGFGP